MARTLSPNLGRLTLIGLVLLVFWGLIAGQSVREAPASVNPEESDFYLYVAIADRVLDGETYYEAAVKEQTERGYPVQPATTIRPPTTTLVVTTLGPKIAYALMAALVASTVLCAIRVFDLISQTRLQWISASAMVAGSLVLFGPPAIYYQETWAVLLLFLSLFARQKSTILAVSLALIACLFRELALPFVFAIAMLEILEKRFRVAATWIFAGIGFLGLYMFHVFAVGSAVETFGSGEIVASSGWLALGGWPFIVGSVRSVTFLSALPLWVSAILVPLALVGWLLQKHPIALSFNAAILGFVLPFLIIGRSNNNYWALLYAVLLLPGLAYSWSALKSLSQSAIGRHSKSKPAEQESSINSANTPDASS